MSRWWLVLACGAPTALAGRAAGQNALGDGTRLDRNLMRGGTGVNYPVRDLNAEMRFRNAVVTGNAPGGFSFRGDVGYLSPGEFMDSLGSNELFRFRRDTLYSGLAGLGIRGTDALQYQFALSTGNAPPPGFTGPGYVLRSGSSAGVTDHAAVVPSAIAPIQPLPETDPRADQRGLELWTLRSPSAFMATRGLAPSVVAIAPSSDGRPYGVTASPLRGLSAVPLAPEPGTPDATDTEQEQPREPAAGGARPRELGAGLQAPPTAVESRVDETARPRAERQTEYERLLERFSSALPADAAERQDPSKLPMWQQRINEARRELQEARRAAARLGEPGEGEEGDRLEGFRAETIRALREAGGSIGRLSPDQGTDAYAVHMRRAEEFLREGQYFFAEERFRAALSVKPDDPMAAIGRVHAQLGASLFAWAGLNLRMLLVSHPELAAARYGPELLPDAARLLRILERLDALAADGRGVGRDTGLLIAYVGYQSGDARAVERGLAIMEGGSEGVDADPQLQRLAALLRGVWTAPAEPGR